MNILFNLLIFSLPFGVIFRFAIVPNAYIYPQDIFAGLIFAAFLVHLIKKRTIPNQKLFVLNLSFILIGFISLLINSSFLTQQSFFVSLGYLLRYAAYSGLLFAVLYLKPGFVSQISKKTLRKTSLRQTTNTRGIPKSL